MFSQMQGLYNTAALNGGMRINSTFKRLLGGWNPNNAWDSEAEVTNKLREIEGLYHLPNGYLDPVARNIYQYDTLLMQGQARAAKQFKDSLQLDPDQKKVWSYVRTKIHRGDTRKRTTPQMRAAAAQRRLQRLQTLSQGPWYGSDPFVNNAAVGNYMGLNAWRARKNQPGYIDINGRNIMRRMAVLANAAARAAANAADAAANGDADAAADAAEEAEDAADAANQAAAAADAADDVVPGKRSGDADFMTLRSGKRVRR